jgi:hypothetical protein
MGFLKAKRRRGYECLNIPFDKPRTTGFRTAPLDYRGTTAMRHPHRRNANRAVDQWSISGDRWNSSPDCTATTYGTDGEIQENERHVRLRRNGAEGRDPQLLTLGQECRNVYA